ncbi:Predicted oxidoreductase [Sinosporangium album]|uniref:Predicted oxidoreductase n=1 Tax=Sinosporangium album TaxID=504805 RepID=A0A1G7U0B2_9ACTN|nr:aldo/keto reductase [Sinosporangium album]SDG40784.1 Predicted oxidoreductase [Sinosporangium album]
MEYRTLGRTGIRVSPLCLGTMMFGAWGNTDHDECERIVHTAVDAGVNFIDTADVYAFGESEEILGRAIKGRRDDLVIATKVNGAMGDSPNRRGNSRRWITRAVEDSLRRLDTDWIDLYQLHRPDPHTPIEETLSALTDLVRQGKIRAFGTSSFPSEDVVEAQWAAERRNLERPATEQLSYSILARHAEGNVLPLAERHNLGIMAWSPLNGGWLTGKYHRDTPPPADSRATRNADHFDYADDPVRARKLDLVDRLTAIADQAGLPLIQLALGFVLSHRAVTSAVIGPRTHAQLVGQLQAHAVRLPPDVLDAIDAVVPPGTVVSPDDIGRTHPALADPALRRR